MASGPFTQLNADQANWYRRGVYLALANLAFIATFLYLVQYDFWLGIGFAIVGSILGGIVITWLAIRVR